MRLISSESLPEWYGHNGDIRSGFRPPKPSFNYCLRSLTALHNESLNIFTHLIAFLCYSVLWIHTINCHSFKNFGSADRLVFSTFFAGIVFCFFISSLFHTFQCHSKRVFKLLAKLDYIGITLMITTSTYSWIYYGFYYSRVPFVIYTSLITFLAIVCLIISLMDRFSEREFQALRGVLFLCIGLSGIAPFVHFCHYHTVTDPMVANVVFKSLILMAVMAVLYITGAIVYMIKIPERIYPNTFDYCFNSHQLFHIFTIFGGLVFFHSLSLIAQSILNFTDTRSHNSTNI